MALQCLYLVATDLGLNGLPPAGTGNPALFAEATGASSWTETSIAEFGFGSGVSMTHHGWPNESTSWPRTWPLD